MKMQTEKKIVQSWNPTHVTTCAENPIACLNTPSAKCFLSSTASGGGEKATPTQRNCSAAPPRGRHRGMTWVGQIQGNLEPPEEKGMENKLFFFLQVLVLKRNAVRHTRTVAGRHRLFAPGRGKHQNPGRRNSNSCSVCSWQCCWVCSSADKIGTACSQPSEISGRSSTAFGKDLGQASLHQVDYKTRCFLFILLKSQEKRGQKTKGQG